MEQYVKPLFKYWACNYTLQVNVFNLPDLEYLQKHITGSILEKTKTKVLSINLILDEFIEDDYQKMDKTFKPIKIMIFKNIERGHQLKVIGVPSKNKVRYTFKVIYEMLSRIPHKIAPLPLAHFIEHDDMKTTNIVFGWYFPDYIVKKYFRDFTNISNRLKTTCVHRPQKFPQLCIKRTKHLDGHQFSCTISSSGHCTVPGQKKIDVIGKIQLLILKDFLEMKMDENFEFDEMVVDEEDDGEDEEENSDDEGPDINNMNIQHCIQHSRLQLINALNCNLVVGNVEKPHRKVLHPSKLHPPTQKSIIKTNSRIDFGDDNSMSLHQRIQKTLYRDEYLGINFNEMIDS